MKSRVTVIIPNYNGSRFLESLFNSLMAQTYSNFQTIFIDDGSSDDSVAIAKTYIGKLPSFEIREYENEGIAANWNRAFDLVETEYFTLLHCDDAYEPDYLTAMIELMDKYPTAAIGHCCVSIISEFDEVKFSVIDSYKEVNFFPTEVLARSIVDEFNTLLRGSYINCPSVIYRSSLAKKVGKFSSELHQTLDWDYWFRVLIGGYHIVGLRQRLFRYRRHSSNASVINSKNLKRYSEELGTFTWAADQGLAKEKDISRGKAGLENIVLYELVVSLSRNDIALSEQKIEFLESVLCAPEYKVRLLKCVQHIGQWGAKVILRLFQIYIRFWVIFAPAKKYL
jgi:glycosyltransferase involved in cell wall biosynthesis